MHTCAIIRRRVREGKGDTTCSSLAFRQKRAYGRSTTHALRTNLKAWLQVEIALSLLANGLQERCACWFRVVGRAARIICGSKVGDPLWRLQSSDESDELGSAMVGIRHTRHVLADHAGKQRRQPEYFCFGLFATLLCKDCEKTELPGQFRNQELPRA